MATAECANEAGYAGIEDGIARRDSDPAAKLRNRVFLGFGSAMALGLSLAGWYVGVRILAAEQTTAETAAATSAAPVQAGSVPMPVQQAAPPMAEMAPQPAPRIFLEVAGLSARQDARFVRQLEAQGFTARADVDTESNVRRILIGPFGDEQSLEAAQKKLQVRGILALERSY